MKRDYYKFGEFISFEKDSYCVLDAHCIIIDHDNDAIIIIHIALSFQTTWSFKIAIQKLRAKINVVNKALQSPMVEAKAKRTLQRQRRRLSSSLKRKQEAEKAAIKIYTSYVSVIPYGCDIKNTRFKSYFCYFNSYNLSRKFLKFLLIKVFFNTIENLAI